MLFSRVFRVLSDPLRDRGVDFLTVNIDEKSCYFRVFFACFLTDCKTGVLIFSSYAQRRVLVHYELPEMKRSKTTVQDTFSPALHASGLRPSKGLRGPQVLRRRAPRRAPGGPFCRSLAVRRPGR